MTQEIMTELQQKAKQYQELQQQHDKLMSQIHYQQLELEDMRKKLHHISDSFGALQEFNEFLAIVKTLT